MARTLYICYFGLREPLVQTQVLPYLREISKGGIEVSLLTFEPDLTRKWLPDEIETARKGLSAEGIKWHCLPYHKSPSAPATVYDILRGTLRVKRLIATERFDVLHARVLVPGVMAALARKLSRRKPKILYDIRGFVPEEYVDAGLWQENGWLYRAVKRIENWLMRESDAFVVLTEKAREILFPESRKTGFDKHSRPVEVIPCCVDLENRFSGISQILRGQIREKLCLNGRKVILHLGALGGLYLTNEIADLLGAAKQIYPTVFAMFLTQSDPVTIVQLLKERGFTENDIFAGRVPASEIQGYLEGCDLALSIVKSTFATQSRSPTKIPEYLASGLPIIANRGVGDVDELIEKNKVGVLLDDLSEASYSKALQAIEALGDVSARCRETAHREFDLENVGSSRYSLIYRRLVGQ